VINSLSRPISPPLIIQRTDISISFQNLETIDPNQKYIGDYDLDEVTKQMNILSSLLQWLFNQIDQTLINEFYLNLFFFCLLINPTERSRRDSENQTNRIRQTIIVGIVFCVQLFSGGSTHSTYERCNFIK
jgi:hypothetical protein